VPVVRQQHPRAAARDRITSTANPRIKAARALQGRKEREKTGRFYLEGIRAVAEALQCGAEVETLIVAPDLLESDFARGLISEASARGTEVLEVSPAVFQSLSLRDGPQGLAAVLRQRWLDLAPVLPKTAAISNTGITPKRAKPPDRRELWVALNAPQDPGNVGTVLRTCDAAGAAGVVLVGPAADPYDPSALRASTGAIFTVPVARASWAELLEWAKRADLSLVGASGAATVNYREATYPDRMVLLMGSEREGLSSERQAACDALVSIPMHGRMDSLNLAVATAIILYEIDRRRSR
jgi:RNA methyltransferase, TrmH family